MSRQEFIFKMRGLTLLVLTGILVEAATAAGVVNLCKVDQSVIIPMEGVNKTTNASTESPPSVETNVSVKDKLPDRIPVEGVNKTTNASTLNGTWEPIDNTHGFPPTPTNQEDQQEITKD